ncbi:F0F1 ATP synthase subunit B' [Rhodobacteraceae bacterium NNCM2]|nr:F0F1 ATP synthase subunit B' [Coraliihabitans acroporae]
MASETTLEHVIHEGEAGKSGLPQLDFDTFPSQIFWLVVCLVVLYFLMTKIALPRIATVLEERADAIADDLDRAEEFKQKAEQAEAAYDQALKEAREKAQEIAAQTRAEIQKDLDAAMAKADAEIAARTAEGEKRIAEIRDSALASVSEVANDTAMAILDSIIPGSADADAVKASVEARLN